MDSSATYAWLRLCDRRTTRGQEANLKVSTISRISGPRTDHRQPRSRPWRYRMLLLAVLMTIAPLASAGEDYDAGKRAYLTGDYAEALRIC